MSINFKRRMCFLLAAIYLVCGCGTRPAQAEVRLPHFFTDNMVLQRDMPVPVWGWAAEGEKVTVKFQDQEVAGTAKDGKWSVNLAPLKAGGPFNLTVSGANIVELKNVLVGEVWISCGQSNMMMGLGAVENGTKAIEESVSYPDIHTITMLDQVGSAEPKDDVASGAWQQANRSTLSGYSAVSYFFARELQKKLKVPIGMINLVVIMPAEAWVDAGTIAADPVLAYLPNHPLHAASKSYNAMIAPLGRFAIRGAAYYQGEYNAGRGKEFRRLMPALISSWRKQWGRDFPFLFVQLPGFSQHLAEADKKLDMPASELAALQAPGQTSAWSELREAQLLTYQTVPNTGMAISIDVGDPQDIHPKRKQQVGERLAIAARALVYGEKIEDTGPIVQGLQLNGGKVIVSFRNAGAGLKAEGGALKGFELAGRDHHFVVADAVIAGSSVVVSSPQVPAPAKVRYAWANYPAAGLFNGNGLPASPFRADLPGTVGQLDTFALDWNAPVQAGPAAFDVRPSLHAWDQKWNSDIADENNVRPGTVYTVAFKAKKAGEKDINFSPYLSTGGTLGTANFDNSGPVSIDSPEFKDYTQAGVRTPSMASAWDTNFVMRLYGKEGEVAFTGLSPVQWTRPTLALSSVAPLDLGVVKPKAAASSTPRTLSNGQAKEVAANGHTFATVLYGAAHVTAPADTLWNQSIDNVGAEIIGKDKELFEITSAHPGATPREMKLVGADGKDGLAGGAQAEKEEFSVKFVGSAKVGSYTATLRIVTQAGNMGTLSRGLTDEPLEGLFYLDIPIRAVVKP